MAQVKEEPEPWEPRGPGGSWGPAQERTRGSSLSVEPGPRLKEEEPELSIKQEPQEFPFHMVTVKSEDDEDKSSVLHQRPTEEKREETNVWECGAEAGCSSVCEGEHLKVEEEELLDREEEGAESDGSWEWESPLRQTLSERRTASTMELKPVEQKLHVAPVKSEDDEDKSSVLHQRPTGLWSYAPHRPFSCSECGKSFTMKGKLNNHMLVHSEEMPHKCSVCAKSFKFKCNLTTHEKIFHNVCGVCERGFKDETARKLHMKTHEKPSRESRKRSVKKQPYVCHVCKEDFAHPSELSDHHKYVHHMCPVCKECSPDIMKLLEHLKRHVEDGTLERKYMKQHSCSQCGKECRSNSELVKHMIVHTRVKPYRCSLCPQDFIFKFKLDQHLSFVHHV